MNHLYGLISNIWLFTLSVIDTISSISAIPLAVRSAAVLKSSALPTEMADAPQVSVREIGDALMTHAIVPLEAIALLLTAAAIGAVVIAMREGEEGE